MTNVFILVSDLTPSGDPTVVRVLASGLPRERFRVGVGVLGPANGPAAEELRSAGVTVLSVPIRHSFDLNGVRRLRQAVGEFSPVVVHAIGPAAARVSRLIVTETGEAGNAPRLVVSGAANPEGGLGGWLAGRQVRRADRVVAATWADGERYRRLGVRGDRLSRITLAAPAPVAVADRDALLRKLGVPPGARLIVAGGQSERGIGPKDAIVAFDMLRFDAPDLHLAVFGTGSGAAALEQFGRALAFDDFRVHFPRSDSDRAAAVSVSTAVWVTAPRAGADEALEGMAAGRPVLAWGTPDLTEVIDDGVTGFLVPVGDRAALASRGRLLLEDVAVAARLGEAGRARAAERFSAARMLEQFGRVYGELRG